MPDTATSEVQRLLAGFDPALVAAIEARHAADFEAAGRARAHRRSSIHHARRAKAEATLASILPATFSPGESWHIASHGDIDALSYLRHALAGVPHFDFVLISTWCMAAEDILELRRWLEHSRIDHLTLCVGEIFPSQYGDEYQAAIDLETDFDARVIVARNHSKVMLAEHVASATALVMEGSANVNTNPRIEQTAIHNDADLLAFYREFFHGLRSIDKRPSRAAG